MASYKIELKRSAVKEIKRLPKADLKRVLAKIDSLSQDPRGPGSIKLSGEEKYRVRVGLYRILYTIEDNVLVVCVVKVGHRKDVYKQR